jgi:hypothetical protein
MTAGQRCRAVKFVRKFFRQCYLGATAVWVLPFIPHCAITATRRVQQRQLGIGRCASSADWSARRIGAA